MKWTLLFALTIVVATACEKSNNTPNNTDLTVTAAASDPVKQSLVGTWRLVEYWEDQGNGTGHWVAATDPDEITFTADGQVKVSGNSPLASRGYNRYRVIDGNHVELFSSSNGDIKETYYYERKGDAPDLIFNPQCRENCARHYKLVG